ncbi:MAG: hypothetical protein LN573_03265 [Rickettsia endosymbiont of Oxypoda opaca]|nr:hypothetical protein [Rickettsia endosymbiont of Oxypoda opaca]
MPQKSKLSGKEKDLLIKLVSKFLNDTVIDDIPNKGPEVQTILLPVLGTPKTEDTYDLVFNKDIVDILTAHYDSKKDEESLRRLAVLTTYF